MATVQVRTSQTDINFVFSLLKGPQVEVTPRHLISIYIQTGTTSTHAQTKDSYTSLV